MKIAVQFDFDGTITEEDVSFLLLDTYVGPRWREYLVEYTEGRIPVGTFNKKVFGMMKADRQTMTELVLNSERVKIRLLSKRL
jgi:2-hydroxy-3-keto-5-methylthiopentenyl-1-phosphate phosphatase